MHRDCGVFNVTNWAQLVSFVEVDKTMIKKMVVHLHKTKEIKDNLNMGKVTIGNLPPRCQGGQNMEKREFHPFCGR